MSAWRRKAIALFPEHRAEWSAAAFPLRDVFHRLEDRVPTMHARWGRDAGDAEAADFFARLHGFAEWCLMQPALWDDAAIGFLEDITGLVPFDHLVPWLPRDARGRHADVGARRRRGAARGVGSCRRGVHPARLARQLVPFRRDPRTLTRACGLAGFDAPAAVTRSRHAAGCAAQRRSLA